MEPISLIVTAAVLGAVAGLKPVAEQAVRDAYTAFRRVIIDHYSDYRDLIDSLDLLGSKPEDPDRQAGFREKLNRADVTSDPALIEAAKAVCVAVQTHSPEMSTAIGMDIGDLEAAVLKAENVQAGESGTAVRIRRAKIEGEATFRNIGVEKSHSDPK